MRECRICRYDPYLKPFEADLRLRSGLLRRTRERLLSGVHSLSDFANGYLYYGLRRTEQGWILREWAPGADLVRVIGDHNGWDRSCPPMTRNASGDWEQSFPEGVFRHGGRYRLLMERNGETFERIPAWAECTVRDPDGRGFSAAVWDPPVRFAWTDSSFYRHRRMSQPLIYEAHVGMATEEYGIGSYREFADRILPRIKEDGYNTVQLMAILQHPYYASFGYQVTGFFSPAMWFGTPDDLRYLIDRAHALGLFVLLDIVHAHSAKNSAEGISNYDGTETLFFKPGDHPAWGTRVFDYSNPKVLHFLLSDLKYWLEEYHFDGFRFDGVTSMLYLDHGLGKAFTSYRDHFSMNTDVDAVTYLTLANELVHQVDPYAVTIAEDMSGMPGMCLPRRDGGIGFNYRLAMGVPDLWIRLIKEQKDEDWDLGMIWYELTTRRPGEKNIGYSESHDQAMVGDKTLIFRLADAEMYTMMQKDRHSLSIDRAMALVKVIRLLTCLLSGEGYLNFMGNEFGHPEWIDFPREGNGWSHKYARRQWSLADDTELKYRMLGEFDRAMLRLVSGTRVLIRGNARQLWIDQEKKLLAFRRGDLLCAVNLHPSEAADPFLIPCPADGIHYRVILSTDDTGFGGSGRIDHNYSYFSVRSKDHPDGFGIYLPPRTMAVLSPV